MFGIPLAELVPFLISLFRALEDLYAHWKSLHATDVQARVETFPASVGAKLNPPDLDLKKRDPIDPDKGLFP